MKLLTSLGRRTFLWHVVSDPDVFGMPEQAMRDVYGAGSVSLHVRKMNNAAFCLYSKTLGYK